MPVDVVKVRLQYAGADGKKSYTGITDCIVKTAKVPLSRVGGVWWWYVQWVHAVHNRGRLCSGLRRVGTVPPLAVVLLWR